MEISSRSLQMLMELGILAGGYGYGKEADAIFRGIEAVRPESEYPLVGRAIVRMNDNRPEEAARILEEGALPLNPENDLTRGYLGLALMLDKRHDRCRDLMEEVVRNDRDETAVRMARDILEQLRTG